MNLTREKKSQIIDQLQDRIARSKSFVVIEFAGTKVVDIEKMRDSLFEAGLQMQVAKNTLLKLAVKKNNIDMPEAIFDKPIALLWSYDDEVASAKQATVFAKEIETIIPLGVVLDGKWYDASQVLALSALPNKQQLLGQLVGTLNAPIANFVYVLRANLSGLVNVLEQIKQQKSE